MDLTLWNPLVLTLRIAGFSTLLSLAAGVGTGYLLARWRFPGREGVDSALTLPLVLPPTVLGYYLVVVLGRNGWLGDLLHRTLGVSLLSTWQGAVVAAAVVSTPLVFRSARAAFEGVDRRCEDAARTLGLGEPEVFLRVALPLAGRGILAGAMLAFARAMGEFGATLMVAGNLPGRTQTLSLAVYEAVQTGRESQAAALVLLTSFVCSAILVGTGRLLRRPRG